MNDFKTPYLFSAPIAGFTNSIIRDLFYKAKADFIFTDMYNVNEILNRDINELDLPKRNYKLIIQLFGNFKDNYLKAIEKLIDIPYSFDINAGCPVKKVIKAKAGSYLLNYPEKIYILLSQIRKNLNVRLSIKFRLGFNKINILENVEAATKAGVDFITIHFRTREEFFKGTIDWDNYFELYSQILKINKNIILNGDINSVDKALYLKYKFEPFGLMIGRAALHDPYIFLKIKNSFNNHLLKNYNFNYNLNKINGLGKIDNFNKSNKINNLNKMDQLKKQNLKIILYIYKELKKRKATTIKIKNLNVTEFRKISHYLLKGLPDSIKIKNFINTTNNIDKIIEYFEKII